jgi:hypothetical protein
VQKELQSQIDAFLAAQ